MATTTFSLSTSQLAALQAQVERGGECRSVLGARITIQHAQYPVDPPTWVGHVVYNPADGGPVLGAEFAL